MGQSHAVARGSQIAANYVHSKTGTQNQSPTGNLILKEVQEVKQPNYGNGIIVASARFNLPVNQSGFTSDQLRVVKAVASVMDGEIEHNNVEDHSSSVRELGVIIDNDQNLFDAFDYNQEREFEEFSGHPGAVPNFSDPLYNHMEEEAPASTIRVLGSVIVSGVIGIIGQSLISQYFQISWMEKIALFKPFDILKPVLQSTKLLLVTKSI